MNASATNEHDTVSTSPVVRARPRIVTDEVVREFAMEVAQLLYDRHCSDIHGFDVRGLSPLTDYIVIGTGVSDRQMRAITTEIEKLARQRGLTRLGTDIDGPTRWVVVDLADVIVHLFDADMRAHYDLDMMWGDAPRLPCKA